jgi:hypothetical protein
MADPKTVAAKLTAQFHTKFGDELQSVVVFGSVSRGESIPGVSDLNMLVLLESMALPTLERAAPLLHDWIRQGNTPPHMYAAGEWAGMTDTFTIEIADMIDARDVLWGSDPVSGEPMDYADLRRQVEREIRDTLLQLRLRLMVNARHPKEIGALLLSGFPSFTAFMRSTLRLAGEAPGLETRSVIERTAALIGADPITMLRCWDSRRLRRHLALTLTDPMVEGYFGFVDRLLAHVDGLPATSHGKSNGHAPAMSSSEGAAL